MEFATNELGQPVIYIVNYTYVEHNVRERSFHQATATLAEAEAIAGDRDCFEITEQVMTTGQQTRLPFLREQQEVKANLLSLYKTGWKREVFEKLNVREPFQSQVNFPLAPEIAKAQEKAESFLAVG